jgi:hypothetical protein
MAHQRQPDFTEWLEAEIRRREREKEVAALLEEMVAEE